MRDEALFQFAKAGEPRPVEAGDYVRIDAEPIFVGVVKAKGEVDLVVSCKAGLFLAPFDEISIVRRAA